MTRLKLNSWAFISRRPVDDMDLKIICFLRYRNRKHNLLLLSERLEYSKCMRFSGNANGIGSGTGSNIDIFGKVSLLQVDMQAMILIYEALMKGYLGKQSIRILTALESTNWGCHFRNNIFFRFSMVIFSIAETSL